MPVKVPLSWIPPDIPDLAKLYILEGPSATGPFVSIETITSIGTYPGYIDHYTTALATSATDWFAIQWEDGVGAKTDISAPIQGGETTLVAEIVKRVRERDSGLSLQVIQQEAEGAIESYFGGDPYDPDLVDTATYGQKNGLTYMVLARALMSTVVASIAASLNVDQATIGLISFKSGTSTSSGTKTTSFDSIQKLLDMANALLGLTGSRVLQIADICRERGWELVLEP